MEETFFNPAARNKTSGYRRIQPSEQNVCSLTVPSFVVRDGEMKRRSSRNFQSSFVKMYSHLQRAGGGVHRETMFNGSTYKHDCLTARALSFLFPLFQ